MALALSAWGWRDHEAAVWPYAAALVAVLAACGLLAALAFMRRRTERRASALLRGVTENAPIGLGFLDRDLRLSHANRSLAQLGERTLGVEPGGDALPKAVATSSSRICARCWRAAARNPASRSR